MVVVLPLRRCCDRETATRSQLPFLPRNSGSTVTAGIRKHEHTFPDECVLVPRSLLVRNGATPAAAVGPLSSVRGACAARETHHPPAPRHGRQQELTGTCVWTRRPCVDGEAGGGRPPCHTELTGAHAARPSPPDQDECLRMRSLGVGPDRAALHLTVTQVGRRKPASLLVSKPANAFMTRNPTSGDAPKEGEAGPWADIRVYLVRGNAVHSGQKMEATQVSQQTTDKQCGPSPQRNRAQL